MIDICSKLKEYKTVAVVGISHNPRRASRQIADYLDAVGYNVVGVNPGIKKAGDIEVYPNLCDIPFKVDIVDVFRRSEHIMDLMPDVLKIKPNLLWLQLGIINDEAVKLASESGIPSVQNKCILVEHRNCD